MPETSDAGRQLASAQLTERLAALVHGPYDGLADALSTVHNMAATLPAARSVTPAAPRNGAR
jgi:hypothetical protein